MKGMKAVEYKIWSRCARGDIKRKDLWKVKKILDKLNSKFNKNRLIEKIN
jgi:hypothetical protein